MLEAFRKTFAFIAGLAIVIAALKNECPRIAAISIGLLLMGVFTVPEALEAFGVIKEKSKENDD